ncbi:hypothetical protein GOV13_05215 [Candidatus Pacearchaeota archaeon]|nr:hypothetical protein [Candidatus Pacearchaeota archaeon]
MGWKNWSYSRKGLFIGAILGLILGISPFFLVLGIENYMMNLGIMMAPIPFIGFFLMPLFTLFGYAFLFALIGYLVGKFKKN